LGDQLATQYLEAGFKLCFVHRRRTRKEDAVRLRDAVFLQRDDVGAGRPSERIDFDEAGRIDATDRIGEIHRPLPRFLDLEDERTPSTEHASVDVLPAHPMKRVARAAGVAHDLRSDHLLDARSVHLAGPTAADTSLSSTTPARPARLRDARTSLR